MPVWNIIRTLSGRGELVPGPLPSSAIKKPRKKNKEDKLFEETDPVDMITGTESIRKGKKTRKGKGKDKDASHGKLPSEERTSKSLKDAQKENAENWREQREAKVGILVLLVYVVSLLLMKKLGTGSGE